ncbi:MAG TPA: hypothetical protein VG326_21375 [Tepidisphaeraceae bacterium]|jgi:hypothetical protein|nr:hypothetical protein [Tepidisphaeraceae bacterium]
MSTPFDPVTPGQLITSAQWNAIAQYLQQVETRLTSLEQAKPSPSLTLTLSTFHPSFTLVRPSNTLGLTNVATLLNPLLTVADPVTSIPGIGSSESLQLANVKITNLGQLAAANTDDVSKALNISTDEATRIVGNAKAFLGQS